MATIHVTAKRDFLESLATSSPFSALAELVWNGFDAGASRVTIHLDVNDLDGIQTIRVRDDGTGIDYAKVQALFGSLGDSWKKTVNRMNGRSIHGKSGRGRFKAFALGNMVEWNTTYKHQGRAYSYKIMGPDFDSCTYIFHKCTGVFSRKLSIVPL